MSAADKRSLLRRQSSIDKLPDDARETLDELIRDPYNGLTYTDIIQQIEEMCGVKLSRSALSRYAQKAASATQESTRYRQRLDVVMGRMRAMSEYSKEHALPELAATINAMILSGLMSRIMDGEDDFANLDLDKALRLATQTQRTAAYVLRYQDNTLKREAVDGERAADAQMEWLRGVIRDNPEVIEDVVNSYNLAVKQYPAETEEGIDHEHNLPDGGDGDRAGDGHPDPKSV